MRHAIRVIVLIILVTSLSGIRVAGSQQTEPSQSRNRTASSRNTQSTPPYRKSAKDAKPLPRLLPASIFSDRPVIARAYEIASEIPLVLAQQPCYCNCDKTFGHTSLLDCYASLHTAGCGICMSETFFAFQMAKQGKTPTAIRNAIIRGDWKKADLNQSR